MQKCLGLYIESNIIKYAKLSKEKDDYKVEAFGIRFFENVGEEVNKIIEETFSFNTPISINLSNEKYLYFDVFALLSKKDIRQTVETEFESYCEEKQYNTNAFENRYALTKNIADKEKLRAIDISVNKIDLTRQTSAFDNYKLSSVMPISVAIGTLANLNKRENQIIVNMEEKVTITTVIEQQIYNVETLDYGSRDVLDNINKVENSYSKAYEICKNTTIYTADVEETEQPYLEFIIPVIYKIAQKLQDLTKDDEIKFQTIYLSGTLASVNNIDLYFQEFLPNIEVKILKPKFLEATSVKINIKEYIEVNSAIALAMCGMNEGVQDLNFRKPNKSEKLQNFFKIETSKGSSGSKSFNTSLKGAFDATEKWLLRGCGALILVMVIFGVFSKILTNSMIEKEEEIAEKISSQSAQISAATNDAASLRTKAEKYKGLTSDLKEIDRKTSAIAESKNLIPNLLNQIMYVIPDKVQLTSIENTTGNTISIQAQSSDYEQLGYFIATIKTKGLLKNVVSSSGVKNGDTVNVTIEGELP